MASSPPLSATDDEEEESDVVGKFSRAYRKGGKISSPRSTDQEKEGFLDRLSDRFTGKAQKRKIEDLQTKNVKLEEQNIALKENLQKEIKKYRDQQQQIHAVLKDCSGIQLGGGNKIQILQYDPDTEDAIPLIKQLMKITLDANDVIIHKLTLSENKLTKNSHTLQKIHSVVQQLRESGLPSTEHPIMEQLSEIVEIATENDDFTSLEKAFESLQVDEGTKRFEDLNGDARRGIRIIVYKFGSMTGQAFANVLGVELETHHSAGEEPIDERSCASIILHWLKKSRNNVHKLIGILKGMERQLIKDSMQNVQEETFAKCCDTQDRESQIQFETITQSVYQRPRHIGDSVLSLMSTRSDVSDTLDMIERHANETLQKTADAKPDIEAILCAMYTLHMDNTRTLHAINDRTVATEEKVNILASETSDTKVYNI